MMPSDPADTEPNKPPLRLRLRMFNFLSTPFFCVMWLMGRMMRVDWKLEAVRHGDGFDAEHMGAALDATVHVALQTEARLLAVTNALRLVDRVIQEHTNMHDNSTIYVFPADHRAQLANFIALLDKHAPEPTPDA